MALIKKIQNGKATIEIYDMDLTESEKKQNLLNVYKTINKIAESQREKGINVDDWFYTAKELEEMKKSGKYNFL